MEKRNKNTAAKIAANNRYNEKAYDRINIAVKKGYKDIVQAIAVEHGETVNSYVKTALKEKIFSDTGVNIDL